jgi:hypothetical protein
MARDLDDDTYYTVQSKDGKIPVKWTAPEVRSLIKCSLGSSHDVNCTIGTLLQEVFH